MKIIVTGAAGFIGSAVVRKLLSEGQRVVAVDKLTYAGNLASLSEVTDHEDFVFEKVDICDGPPPDVAVGSSRRLGTARRSGGF